MKNYLLGDYSDIFKKVSGILKIKLFLLFFIISSVFIAGASPSQVPKISLDFNAVTIQAVLQDIESKTDYLFVYNSKELNLNQKVSIKANGQSIELILKELFKDINIDYSFEGNNIVLKKSIEKSLQDQKGKKVTGKVIDETGASLPSVTITVLGSTRGVITDNNGKFEISDILPTDRLVFSFIGMKSQIFDVGNETQVTITLLQNTEELEDVTIVAFGKQKKESVIGSITTVKPSELKIPSSNLTTALAGRMAGIISYQRSGEPGKDNAEFFIRGVTTFGYKKDPLILIDNNEVTSQELSRIHPDDIGSFSIMKDATATALYGSRGANGVILVTTKEGNEGKAKINVRLEESLSQPTNKVDLADPVTYMLLHNEAITTRNPLRPSEYSQSKIDNTIAGVNPYVYPANDWYETLFKDYAINKRLNLNVSGGGKVARYYIAGSISSDNGLLKVDEKNNFNNNVDLKRYMLRSNVNINVTKTTQINVRLQGAFDDYTGPIDGGAGIYQKVMETNPVLFPSYYAPDKNNTYTQHILFGNAKTGTYTNPYADMVKGYKNYSTSNMSAQFELNQDLDFIAKGLKFKGMFNTARYSNFDVSRYYNPYYYSVGSFNKTTQEYTLNEINADSGTEYLGYSEGPKSLSTTTYFEGSLNWAHQYNAVHNVSGLLVGTMREQLFANAGDLQQSLPYRNISVAGRATYDYFSRYFLELNFGYNGSERFSKKERFGFFPSVGAGWIISNEPFWTGRLKEVVTKLKLKATYGLSGNDAIGDATDRFFYLSNVNLDDAANGASFGTYQNYTRNGVSISRYANDGITWETATKANLGVELGLSNELEIQADFFKEDRSNILMDRSSIPTTMGLQSAVRANVGEASAKGVDISVNYNHSFNKDIWITAMGNFTYSTSKFIVFEEPTYTNEPWLSNVGQSLGQQWGYVAERLFIDEAEIKNSPVQFGDYKAGDIKYKDINGDGKISPLDMVPMGFPVTPEIIYGFGFSMGYKAFDINCFFQGLAKESFWIDASTTSPFVNGQNALLEVYANNHWSEDNRDVYALWPRLSDEIVTNNVQPSSWFMRDGSFLRLKSAELGYTLPKKLISKVGLADFRVYLSGTNLLTFSKFKLWDPEMGGNGFGYPIQRVFNIGVKLSF